MNGEIPKKTIYRLSLYSRCLDRLDPGTESTLSSETLAKVAGVKSSQLRKDLAFCGHIGKRGQGYEISLLQSHLHSILKHATLRPVILIGVGNLGTALLRYEGFLREGFEIVGAFDQLAGTHNFSTELPVLPMTGISAFIAQKGIRIAILCVPAGAAQTITDLILASGIQAILNFAPVVLRVPPEVTVNNVNLAIELESLGYFLQ